MSHMIEALRRAEQEHAGNNWQPATGDGASLPETLREADRQIARPALRPLICRPNPERLLATGEPERIAAAESFRLLRYRLEEWRGQKPLTCVMVASAVPREGKTLVAANLAMTLALASTRVLLVDGDLRRPGLGTALDLPPLPGLAEALAGKLDWRAACRALDPLGFAYLPAGKPPANPAELLSAATMRQVLRGAAATYDWVIVDSPPLIPFSDALYLAAASDGVLMVARDGYTPAPEFQKSLRSLQGFPLLGVILNGAAPARQKYYRGYSLAA